MGEKYVGYYESFYTDTLLPFLSFYGYVMLPFQEHVAITGD